MLLEFVKFQPFASLWCERTIKSSGGVVGGAVVGEGVTSALLSALTDSTLTVTACHGVSTTLLLHSVVPF